MIKDGEKFLPKFKAGDRVMITSGPHKGKFGTCIKKVDNKPVMGG